MRALREDERDEIEAVKHFVKHVITKPNVEPFKIWEALLELDRIGKKYVLSKIVTEEELNELTELDDMKELITKFMSALHGYLETKEKNNN